MICSNYYEVILARHKGVIIDPVGFFLLISRKFHEGLRAEPDSENLTVRERRETYGNVSYGEG